VRERNLGHLDQAVTMDFLHDRHALKTALIANTAKNWTTLRKFRRQP
jgi:hypothetical protein